MGAEKETHNVIVDNDLKMYLLSRLDQISKEIKEVATEVEKWMGI